MGTYYVYHRVECYNKYHEIICQHRIIRQWSLRISRVGVHEKLMPQWYEINL
jgi:hypothetical protein